MARGGLHVGQQRNLKPVIIGARLLRARNDHPVQGLETIGAQQGLVIGHGGYVVGIVTGDEQIASRRGEVRNGLQLRGHEVPLGGEDQQQVLRLQGDVRIGKLEVDHFKVVAGQEVRQHGGGALVQLPVPLQDHHPGNILPGHVGNGGGDLLLVGKPGDSYTPAS